MCHLRIGYSIVASNKRRISSIIKSSSTINTFSSNLNYSNSRNIKNTHTSIKSLLYYFIFIIIDLINVMSCFDISFCVCNTVSKAFVLIMFIWISNYLISLCGMGKGEGTRVGGQNYFGSPIPPKQK